MTRYAERDRGSSPVRYGLTGNADNVDTNDGKHEESSHASCLMESCLGSSSLGRGLHRDMLCPQNDFKISTNDVLY